MKQLLILFISILVIGCTPVKQLNVQRRHTYYEKYKYNTYMTPMWIPGPGILLETRIVAPNRVWGKPLPQREVRRKH